MGYTLKKNLANRKNYGSARDTKNIKYIVIHYTGNDGDTDENNGKYFHNNVIKASAHYFVDSDSVTQSVPDNYVAYAVGGSKYSNCSKTGGGKYYQKCTNSNSLSIELCDDRKDGKVYPSTKTIANAIELTKKKMKEYGIPVANVIRHFDVNGKSCPAYWCGSAAKDAAWKSAFWGKLSNSSAAPAVVTKYKVATNGARLALRASAGTSGNLIQYVTSGTTVTGTGKSQSISNVKWLQVTVSGKTGWMHSGYLKKYN